MPTKARFQPDGRVKKLAEWIRAEQLKDGKHWTDIRVIIFTEYDDTKRYLLNQLNAFCRNPAILIGKNSRTRSSIYYLSGAYFLLRGEAGNNLATSCDGLLTMTASTTPGSSKSARRIISCS